MHTYRRRLRRITAAPCPCERASVAQSSGFLEACPGFLGIPWAVLGRFGEIWGRPGGLLGELGGMLDCWTFLGRLGGNEWSWRPSWKPSWPSCRPY